MVDNEKLDWFCSREFVDTHMYFYSTFLFLSYCLTIFCYICLPLIHHKFVLDMWKNMAVF
jgi:hypothetical protein